MHAKDIQKTKKLIARGYLKEAFLLVTDKMDELDAPIKNEILLLQSQFSNLEKMKRLNLVDGTIELNRIVYGFLGVLDELSSDSASPATTGSKNQSSISKSLHSHFLLQSPQVNH